MSSKIETKVVCEICGNTEEDQVESIEINGEFFNFCHDSRSCLLRESKRIVEKESEDEDDDRN